MFTKGISIAALLFAALVWSHAALALFVHVQPIQVCADDGSDCANSIAGGSPNDQQLFPAIADKIWLQASIDVVFFPWMVVNSSAMLNEDMFNHLSLNANSMVINMWFVESLSDCGGPVAGTLFGLAVRRGASPSPMPCSHSTRTPVVSIPLRMSSATCWACRTPAPPVTTTI